MPGTELKVVENATCTFCGCVCDDMELTVEGDHITKAKNACVLGKAWFLNHHVEDRTVALVDVRRSKSAPAADIFLQVRPRKDFEALWALRALVKGVRLGEADVAETGIPLEQLEDLAGRMKSCRFGVLFFGMGLS